MRRVGFLHIGKTAGTAIRAVIAEHNAGRSHSPVEVFTHEYSLPKIWQEDASIAMSFFVRDPVERFVSGFNSRLRRGQPRYNSPWSEQESTAFSRFPSPGALGEALSAQEPARSAAQAAMQAIYHARLDFTHYLQSPAFLESNSRRILFIGTTRSFESDFPLFRRTLGIDPKIEPPRDAVGAHRNPDNMETSLSPLAQENLRSWYAQDYAIYEWCLAQRARILETIQRDP